MIRCWLVKEEMYMQKLLNVEFDHKPQSPAVYKSGVDVITRCEEKQKVDPQDGTERTVWECDLERYESDEYIKYQMAQYEDVQEQLTQAQIGLVEAYEMILALM